MQINFTPSVIGTNPPEATKGTNCGTGIAAQISIIGDDSYGLITVNTGDNPSGQKVCDISFQQNHGTDNLIIEVVPVNRQAFPVTIAAEAITGSGFELNASQELNDNDVYQWTYRITKIIL